MKTVTVTTEHHVTGCNNCPFTHRHVSQGECWTECAHKNHGRGYYENILFGCNQEFENTPAWCPLGLGAPQDNGSSAHRKNVDTYFWRIDIGFKAINANNGSNNGDYLVISSKLYPVTTDGMQGFKLVTECYPFGDVNKQPSVDQEIIDQISKITEEYVAKIADTMPPI